MLELLPTLDRGALSHGTADAWGNLLGKKTPNTMRVCFQNLDGISQSPDGDGNLKLHLLLQFTTTYQVDVFAAMAKLNTCWDLVPPISGCPIKLKVGGKTHTGVSPITAMITTPPPINLVVWEL